MFSELRSRLNTVRYMFVIGYAFRDDHIQRLFKYAASKNPQLIIFLISPSAHRIYYLELKIYNDKDFRHGFYPDSFTSKSFNTAIDSDLKGRVICLPYRCQDIMGQLNHVYLESLKKGQQCEARRLEEPSNKLNNSLTGWKDCLSHYLECEYFEKIKDIIEQKMGWNTLMKINHELGGKIIVKAYTNSLLWEKDKKEWFDKYKEYLPVFPERMQVEMTVSDDLFLRFKHPSQKCLSSYDLFLFYESLFDIYNNHLIFSNPEVSGKEDNHGLKIKQILEYLEIWKQNIPLNDYPNKRRDKYNEEMRLIEQRITQYHENRSEDIKNALLQNITEVEVNELKTKISAF